ncbi:MAG: response regulator transcription factor [Clostridia bacterium]|nr:response regulator transcription factor [Clostridia bacterium]
MKKTILVVEDDKRLNEIITDNLDEEGYHVLCAYDGDEAIDIFDENKVDLVLIDIMMPKIDGWSVCRRLRKQSDVIIVIISARSTEDDKLQGYELGADDYVVKPFSPMVLVAKIKTLFNRFNGETIKDNVIKKGRISVDKSSYLVKIDEKNVQLTAKEYGLLLLFIENENRVFDRDKLIKDIWGYDYFGENRVVDAKIKTLRKKLGDCSSYIKTIVGIGYKFEVDR